MTEANPDARPEPMYVTQFEGEYVRLHRAKLPSITLDMDQGFERHTHLNLEVEARVLQLNHPESKDRDHRGELVREHMLVIEQVVLAGSMTADEADPGVGGSAGTPRIEERDDFGAVVQDCWYDSTDLIVYHRGACDVCYSRVPREVVDATVAAHTGGEQPTNPNDPGF